MASAWQSSNWVLYGPDSRVVASPLSYDPDFQVVVAAAGTYTLAIAGSKPERICAIAPIIGQNIASCQLQNPRNPCPVWCAIALKRAILAALTGTAFEMLC